MSKPRIKKKLCKNAAKYLPNVPWDHEIENPVCDYEGELPSGTPMFVFYGNGIKESISAWAMLKKIYNLKKREFVRDDEWGLYWLYGHKATTINVFMFAYWEDFKFESMTGLEFVAQHFVDLEDEENGNYE